MNNIVLFEPEKPANVGNIMRSCRALNATLTIVGYINFSLADKDLRRAGMDYLIGMNVLRYATLEEFYHDHRDDTIYYVTRYSKFLYSKIDVADASHNYYFMFGRESTGIPYEVLQKNYDNTIRIPMVIDSRSLNLSNCVAIVLSEALRQQNYFSLSTIETIKGADFLDR